ncbi:MAG: hypothetical protein IPH73_04105 [Rhodocyclales bacterium]|nr:hypothetical protein [Rhodocyclales bacterium]
MSEIGSDGKKGKGFAGLSSLVSDVSEVVADTSVTREATPSSGAREPSPDPQQRPRIPPIKNIPDANSGSGRLGSGAKNWIIGAVVVLILIGLASTDKEEVSAYTQPPSYSTPTTSLSRTPSQPTATPLQKIPSIPPPMIPELNEEKPPIGTDLVLNRMQIRYCLTEMIRVKAVESIVSRASNTEIDRFNTRIDDYNSRCGRYRYRNGEVELINAELNFKRDSIAISAKTAWIREAINLQSPPASIGKNTGRSARTDEGWEVVSISPVAQPPLTPHSQDVLPSVSQPLEVPSKQVNPATRSRYSIPENAEVDYSGHGWMCRQGFRQVGGQCDPVLIPDNAMLDYSGHGWMCKKGFRQVGGQCDPVLIPDNAMLDYSGHGWMCKKGFRQVGGQLRSGPDS